MKLKLLIVGLLVLSITSTGAYALAVTISVTQVTSDGVNSDERVSVSGENGLLIDASPIENGTSSLLQVGSEINGTSTGTLLGVNSSFSGDFINAQINNQSKFKVDNLGNVTIPAGSTFQIGGVPATSASVWTSDSASIYNPNSGNVGVGTTTPAYKLDVNGAVNFGDNIFIENGAVSIGTTSSGASALEIDESGYLQIRKTVWLLKEAWSVPDEACATAADFGRMQIDAANNRLLLCANTYLGPSWHFIDLNYYE